MGARSTACRVYMVGSSWVILGHLGLASYTYAYLRDVRLTHTPRRGCDLSRVSVGAVRLR